MDALGSARWIRGAGLLLLLALLPASPALAIDLEVGRWIELKATHPQGVPLHQQPRPSLMGRAPDAARAEVRAMDQAQHWIQIRLEDGRVAWIIENYVERVVEAPSPPSGPPGNDEWLVWGSGDGCRQVVGDVPFENLIGRAEFLFFSSDGSAEIWEVWKWPFAIRFSRFLKGVR